MTFSPIEPALEAFKNGEFLIVMDDESRENEGDLIIAAEKITTEKMAFLVRHSSGFICAPLSVERADQLSLRPMVEKNTDKHGTAYTVTCDYSKGTTTGISASDRAETVRRLADPEAKGEDFGRPGHICPLRAVPGLLKVRRGHTEAAIELCRICDLQPAAAICELVRDDDGMMMRLKDCEMFGKKHNVRIVTIDQIVEFASRN